MLNTLDQFFFGALKQCTGSCAALPLSFTMFKQGEEEWRDLTSKLSTFDNILPWNVPSTRSKGDV